MAAAVTSFKQPDLKEKLPLRPRFAEFLATINIPESVDQAGNEVSRLSEGFYVEPRIKKSSKQHKPFRFAGGHYFQRSESPPILAGREIPLSPSSSVLDSAATFMVNPLRSVGICLMAHEMPLSPSAMIACMTSEASRLRPCECRIKEEKDDEDVDVLKAAPKAALSAGAKAVTGAIAGGTAAIAIAELLPKLEPQLVDASAGPATLTPTKVHVCSCDCEPKCRERPAFLIGEGLNASLCYLDECTAEESILEEVFSTVCPEGEEQTYTSDSRTLCYDSEAVDKSTREIESFSLSVGKAIVPTQKTTEVSPMLWGISKDDVRRKRAPLIKTSPVPPKRNQKSIQGSGQIRPSPRIQIAGVDDNREVGADSLNSDTSTTTRYELQEELKRIQRRVRFCLKGFSRDDQDSESSFTYTGTSHTQSVSVTSAHSPNIFDISLDDQDLIGASLTTSCSYGSYEEVLDMVPATLLTSDFYEQISTLQSSFGDILERNSPSHNICVDDQKGRRQIAEAAGSCHETPQIKRNQTSSGKMGGLEYKMRQNQKSTIISKLRVIPEEILHESTSRGMESVDVTVGKNSTCIQRSGSCYRLPIATSASVPSSRKQITRSCNKSHLTTLL